MGSVEQSSLNTSDIPNALHQDNYNKYNNCINNNNNSSNNKMISSALIKHDVSSTVQTPTAHNNNIIMSSNAVQMENNHMNHYQRQQNEQQRMLLNNNNNNTINKSTQIVNKSSVISTAANTNQQYLHNNQQQQQQQHNIAVSSGSINSNSVATINSPKMGSRRIFTPQFKLQVLESYRSDSDCKGNQRATARKYNIHRRQIQKWLQCESNLRSSVANINQSQVKHQFHNINPTTTTTTIAHNSQFVSQQQQQHPHHYQQQQNLSSSLYVPSPSSSVAATTTNTLTPTPCSTTGVLVAANFAAVVAAAASIANNDKTNTRTTAALSPLRPTAIVGGTDKAGNANTGNLLHPHAQLTHMTHHALHPHTHHHHHLHGHHHHAYSSLPYTHNTVPILTHQQQLYPHPATAVLLAAAHHHLPPPPPPAALATTVATLHCHHYQQRQHEYQALQQQQQQQQQPTQQQASSSACLRFTAASVNERAALEVEVSGNECTESAVEVKTEYQGNNCKLTTLQATNNQFENNNNNSGRICMSNVYKCFEKGITQELEQQQTNENSAYLLKTKIEQTPIKPIDLSLTGARRNQKILCTADATMTYDKHILNIHDDEVAYQTENNKSKCSEETSINESNQFIVDLTFRKRKVITTETLTNLSTIAEHDIHPEKIAKFTNQLPDSDAKIKDVNDAATTKSTVAQNVTVKPVKLFKPYLLHEEKEDQDLGEQQSAVNAGSNQQQPLLTPLPLSVGHFGHMHAATEISSAGTFQGIHDNKNTFPVEHTYFPSSASNSSKPASPKSALCSPTNSAPALSPTGFHCSKGSPVSGYESSSSTYSECSSYRGLSNYSFELQWRAIYGEQMNSPPHTMSYAHTFKQTMLPMQQEQQQQQQRVQRWLDQDTQCSMATNSSRSSPTPSHTPSPITTPATTTTTSPPAVNTTITLYA